MPTIELPDNLTVRQTLAEVPVGRKQVYRAIHKGELRAARVNDRGDYIIRRPWLVAWLEGLAGPVAAPTATPLRKRKKQRRPKTSG